ncbi:MAG TPA: enoyl-CoA hydratase-related protein [Acidimicrobiia bacterium]|nr:enoyl-CoA hydratase-related protein [Acidimicrobiia bacterium]
MSLVKLSTEGAVALVTLDRPPVNALSAELSADLLAAFTECQDPGVRAVVVTGEPHFAAGADITGFKTAFESGTDDRLANALTDAIWALEALEKPAIAAVRGFALGGGLELAMGADFRYLSDDAKVGQPEIMLGIIPGAGGTQRLPRIVGYQIAKEMVYSGRHVTAEEAEQIGLADKVVKGERLLEVAMEDAARWAEGPTRAIAAAKRSLNDGWGQPMSRAIEIEANEFGRVFGTEDAREGVSAFLEKRKPGFGGR